MWSAIIGTLQLSAVAPAPKLSYTPVGLSGFALFQDWICPVLAIAPLLPHPLFQVKLSRGTKSNLLQKSKSIISRCFSQTWSSITESLTGSHKTSMVSISYVTVFYSHYSVLPTSTFPYFAWDGFQANTLSLVYPCFSHLKIMFFL